LNPVTQRLLLLCCLGLASEGLGQAPQRPCAFVGMRRGTTPPCLGETRTVLGRPYCVHMPSVARPGLPIVLLLHGYSSNGEAQSRYFDLDSAVDRRAFILVKPNGTPDAMGAQYWTAGRHLSATGPDDVAYLMTVLDDVATAFGADRSRVYVVGHSNGAFMANRLACEHSERIAAFVSLAGAVDPTSCKPSQPVSVLTVHGTTDRLIQYSGGTSGFLGDYPSAEATVAFWAKADGCAASRTPGKLMHLTCQSTDAETVVSSYSGCPPGITVEHWRVDGVGHVPDFALPAWPDAVLDFLWAHAKPKPTK
jgi:polyhydroxybutyrate depolymerase